VSAAVSQAVTLAYYTSDVTATSGSDYQWVSGGAAFQPGQTTTTISIAVYGDTVPEANETFTLNLYNPVNATLARTQAIGKIIDDEPISLSISDASVSEGNSGVKAISFSISLSQALTPPVSVNFASADGTATAGSDYQATSGTLTFNPGDTVSYVALLVNGDTQIEPNETFTVNLSNASGAA